MKEKYNYKKHIEGYIFLVILIIGIILRFIFLPWDFGGFWMQLWSGSVGCIYFFSQFPKLSLKSQKIIRIIFLPLVSILPQTTLYFAPQIMIPFLIISLIIGRQTILLNQNKRTKFILLFILYIPLIFWSYRSINRGFYFYSFKNIDSAKVKNIILQCTYKVGGYPNPKIILSNRNKIKSFIDSLSKTSPYSPNHEGIHKPWKIKINLFNNKEYLFELGEGNRVDDETAWIEFGVEVYQNKNLYKIVREKLNIQM